MYKWLQNIHIDYSNCSGLEFLILSDSCSFLFSLCCSAFLSCLSSTSALGSNLLRRILFTAEELTPNIFESLSCVHSSGCSSLRYRMWSILQRDSLFNGLHGPNFFFVAKLSLLWLCTSSSGCSSEVDMLYCCFLEWSDCSLTELLKLHWVIEIIGDHTGWHMQPTAEEFWHLTSAEDIPSSPLVIGWAQRPPTKEQPQALHQWPSFVPKRRCALKRNTSTNAEEVQRGKHESSGRSS